MAETEKPGMKDRSKDPEASETPVADRVPKPRGKGAA